jgi:ribosome-associated translation inhibitor RaiA
MNKQEQSQPISSTNEAMSNFQKQVPDIKTKQMQVSDATPQVGDMNRHRQAQSSQFISSTNEATVNLQKQVPDIKTKQMQVSDATSQVRAMNKQEQSQPISSTNEAMANLQKQVPNINTRKKNESVKLTEKDLLGWEKRLKLKEQEMSELMDKVVASQGNDREPGTGKQTAESIKPAFKGGTFWECII